MYIYIKIYIPFPQFMNAHTCYDTVKFQEMWELSFGPNIWHKWSKIPTEHTFNFPFGLVKQLLPQPNKLVVVASFTMGPNYNTHVH